MRNAITIRATNQETEEIRATAQALGLAAESFVLVAALSWSRPATRQLLAKMLEDPTNHRVPKGRPPAAKKPKRRHSKGGPVDERILAALRNGRNCSGARLLKRIKCSEGSMYANLKRLMASGLVEKTGPGYYRLARQGEESEG